MTVAIREPGCAVGLWESDTGDADDPIEHAMYSIASHGVREYPFPHMMVREVFPAWFYRRMIENFPTDEELVALNERYPLRRTMKLTDPEATERLAPSRREFWERVRDEMGRPEFMEFVVRRFGAGLSDRFTPDLEPLLFLFRDVGGYAIGPHADTPKKVVTMLFYLPEDERSLGCGTTLLKKASGSAPADATANDWTGFTCVKTAPFEANSMTGFLVTDKSYHGVRRTPEGVARRSMQFFILDRSRG